MHAKRFLMCVVFIMSTLVPSGTAFAWGIEWLDQLTGPGPFVGFKIDVRALCWLSSQPNGAGEVDVVPPSDPTCLRDGLPGRTPSPLAGRTPADFDRMRAYISVEAAWLSSARNEMFGILRFDPRTEVDLFAFRPAVMFRAFRWVDAGLVVGINRFSGPALAESSFTWFSPQPRVVFTPFATSPSRVARAMEFRTDLVFIPERVRDEFVERVRRDLPIQPGSFEGGELRLMFGVEIDLFRLF